MFPPLLCSPYPALHAGPRGGPRALPWLARPRGAAQCWQFLGAGGRGSPAARPCRGPADCALQCWRRAQWCLRSAVRGAPSADAAARLADATLGGFALLSIFPLLPFEFRCLSRSQQHNTPLSISRLTSSWCLSRTLCEICGGSAAPTWCKPRWSRPCCSSDLSCRCCHPFVLCCLTLPGSI